MSGVARHVAWLAVLIGVMPTPAAAQVDISGDWDHVGAPIGAVNARGDYHEEVQDRLAGPDLGDYAGLPLNAIGRFAASTYSPSWLSVPENQCIPHPSTYQFRSPGGYTILREYDPVTQRIVAYRIFGSWALSRVIWMDGRPHPDALAPHTYHGFSTGRWEGDRLVVETTHLKRGFVRRNGVFHTDRATMVEQFVRRDNYLTIITAVADPYYYEVPLIRSADFKLVSNPRSKLPEFGGLVDGGTGPNFYKCVPIDEIAADRWQVPSFAPGTNDQLDMFAKIHSVPVEAALGGVETMYPEYMQRVRDLAANKVRGRQLADVMTDSSVSKTFPPPPSNLFSPQVTSRHVKGKVWMITAGGRNIAVQIGDEGVLVVDPGQAETADAVLAEIRRLAGDKRVRVIINTNADPSNIGGNLTIGAGRPDAPQRAAIVAHENAHLRMTKAGVVALATPSDSFFRGTREYYFNDEPILITYMPKAHTDGDVIVLFRQSDVIVAGDIIQDVSYPIIDVDAGGSINGTIDALNFILDQTVAAWRRQGGTMVVTRRGRLYDEGDVTDYRDVAAIARDRIIGAIRQGKTPNQVKASRLLRDFDGRYGSGTGAGSSDGFLDSVLRSLPPTDRSN